MSRKTALIFFIFLIAVSNAYSNFQLRVDKFKWKLAETPNLLVYYYSPDKEEFELKPILEQLEYTHHKISKLLNVEFAKKSSVFVYYNHNHFEQNRIAHTGEGVEGFSEAFKNRLVIPLRYSRYDIEHLMAHEYTHIAQFEILYGGFWRSAKLIKGLSGLQPLWVIEGQAEHISHKVLDRKWSSYDRMILRDAVLYGYLYNLRELQNFNALFRKGYLGYKEGHSAIDFLVENEGEEVNFRLLKALRNNIDPVKAFETASEKFASLKDFDTKWRKNLESKVDALVKDKDRITDISETVVGDKYHNRNPVYAGNADFYYVSDRWGINEIYLNKNGKDKKVLPGFFGSNVKGIVSGRRYDRIIDYNHQENMIAFAARKKQKESIYLYDVNKKKIKQLKFKLNEIRSPSFSPDGKTIVFTALKDSRRNIYIYRIEDKQLTQLTDDEHIDYSPVFFDSGKKIMVSTERDLNTDLRLIDIASGKVRWLTKTPHHEVYPVPAGRDEKIYYSSDKNGIYNLYECSAGAEVTHTALTNISGGILYPNKAEGDNILCSAYFNESFKIVKLPLKDKEYKLKSSRKYITSKSTMTLADVNILKRKPGFSFSTDFFLPSFLYATDIGFVGGGLLQGL
ncbi:TolB family protein [Elusimicrobiota bacterium]